ncbi:hypothetical protein AALO_G00289650 [Alosa alosa]|uniref:Uncharacterized protein n=1 Tax=Alosa alosa TaxID=278164 RepID=A0AAV6FGF4_9TELE|nr:uncharacterized protein LOC125288715 [Alosa alosa]KAG5261883.1 hypothetical protein AALO_G00289650 [Alosa alosa]
MANMCFERRALVEIPEPQPKIAGHLRRSYMDVLSTRVGALPNSTGSRTKRASPLVACRQRQWVDESDSRGEEVEKTSMVLSSQQLVQLLSSLILLEQKQTCTEHTSYLKLLLEDLLQKKANVYRSIPYSRLGSNRDAHCYRKAYPHLVAFKRSCQEGGQTLARRGEWESLLEFALTGWRYVSELPQWDTARHNTGREHCYTALARHCSMALRHHQPAPSKAREMLRRLKMPQGHNQQTSSCVEELKQLLKDLKH